MYGAYNDPFFTAKIQTATFYAHNVLTQWAYLQKQIVEGSGDVMTGNDEMFEVELVWHLEQRPVAPRRDAGEGDAGVAPFFHDSQLVETALDFSLIEALQVGEFLYCPISRCPAVARLDRFPRE